MLNEVGKLWDGFLNGGRQHDPAPSLLDSSPCWVRLGNGAVVALWSLDPSLQAPEEGHTVAPCKGEESCPAGNQTSILCL